MTAPRSQDGCVVPARSPDMQRVYLHTITRNSLQQHVLAVHHGAWLRLGCVSEGVSMIQCAMCGDLYWPTGRWRADICAWYFDAHCAASQELRVEEGVPLTPRQRTALARIHEIHARRTEEDG